MGIGTFTIKNEDKLIVKLDDKAMYDHLALNKKNTDKFIEKRTHFIRQFISQRKLNIQYELIPKEKNRAGKII